MTEKNPTLLSGNVGRRTVVRGAAWSVPAIAAATAMPFAAATVQNLCPPFEPGGDTWSAQIIDGGFNTTTGAIGWQPDGSLAFIGDNLNLSPDAHYWTFSSLPVTAGVSYTLSFVIESRLALGNRRGSTLEFTIGGQYRHRWYTSDARTYSDGVPSDLVPGAGATLGTWYNVPGPISVTWTAAADGQVPLYFDFWAWGREVTNTSNDDFQITNMSLTCA
ncbi:MAG TPA: hypothetical protein PKE40_09465 [Arachnia sp.]|nr:hypothetical protein [Arachnia sp.]HMT86568.1 hypothetical protein [Arachnia sp.]